MFQSPFTTPSSSSPFASKTAAILVGSILTVSGQDSDSDSLSDHFEKPSVSYSSQDLVLSASDLKERVVTANGGILSAPTAIGANDQITAISFEDNSSGYGYYRLNKWTGDQSSAKGASFNFGIWVQNLGREIGSPWASTSTADVRLVSSSGERVEANLKHGGFEILPLQEQYREIYQYQIPLTPESFETSDSRLTRVLSDLAYIEIRAEFWGWSRGVESYLVPAGEFWNSAVDTDGDGIADYLDKDSDADGISDADEGSADFDNDGLPNYRDRDSDNDGILDITEGLFDNDGDGFANSQDLDADGDGILDAVEGEKNTDADSTPDYLDTDSDNDGVADAVEGSLDLDGDSIPNYLDTDSDEDGIPDGDDSDTDGDGISNFEEAFAVGQAENLISNGNFNKTPLNFETQYTRTLSDLDEGVSQPEGAFEIAENANDATANFPDFGDANNGGNMMVVWTGPTANELVWSQEIEVSPEAKYVFSAEVASAIEGLEPALDFRVNGISLGVPITGGAPGEWERFFAGYSNGSDTTIKLEIYSVKTTLQQTAFALDAIAFSPITTDSDGDGSANFFDRDSDNDSLSDEYEGQADFDQDGFPNFLDLDSDGDGILDIDDSNLDPDGDGIPGYQDIDSDNDNIEDFREGSGDFDGDGIPDHLDSDSDNDGTPDAPGEDSDNDGLWNEEETLTADTDNDGTPDYLDIDSDNDGLLDSVEFFNDIDADGIPDYRDYQPNFTCSGYAFESYNAQTQLALVDVNAGVFVNLGNTDHGLNYNAIGYRGKNNYIYGLNRSENRPELLRIGSDGSVAKAGLISGLPNSYVAGTFAEDDLYWVSGGGRIYGIDVDGLVVVSEAKLSPKPRGAVIDLAYNKVDGILYGSTSRGDFIKIDRSTGATKILGNNGKTFGALICDFNGTVYGFDNKGTGAFRVNLTNGAVTWMASAPKTGINDGTICPDAILALDSDGDGINDEYDLDDDNDGVHDELEGSGYNPTGDEDNDGISNWTDSRDDGDNGDGSLTDYTDSNGDGIPDVFDIDQDGQANHVDSDADGDGLNDSEEQSGDFDQDGAPNFLDTDSDNDGVTDASDGLGDEDGDGNPNYLDAFDDRDEDNDGIPNGLEGTGDTDGDGTPDYLDTDSDDDGFSDAEEAGSDGTDPRDSDGDGILNFQDFDDDGDEIPTAIDPCPLCNLEDNFIEFDISNVDILSQYGVYPEFYQQARSIWNEVKYLLNCNTEGIPLEQEKRGFDEEKFYLQEDSEVFVTVIFDGAEYHNTLAYYDAEDPQGTWKPIWKNFATGPTAPLIPGSSVSLGILPAGSQLRFGLVMDGGNGGEKRIYQDSFLNPAGMEFSASNIELKEVDGDPIVLAFEDQLFAGRDNDFNDVIIMVEILPSSLGTSQFGLVADKEAVDSSSVHSILEQVGMNDPQYESTAELLYVPAGTNSVTFDLLSDDSAMEFSLAIYDYDEVSLWSPETLASRQVAGYLSELIFDNREAGAGKSITINPAALGLAGKNLGLMLIPNNTVDKFNSNPHRYTPRGAGDDLKRQPLFSLNNANPEAKDQFLIFSNEVSTLVCIEDYTRAAANEEAGANSTETFSGAQIRITPALVPMSFHNGAYREGSPDITSDWDGDDGYSDSQNGDY
ncbi:MAG: DUF6923 family protein [Roseibacillus sp.]